MHELTDGERAVLSEFQGFLEHEVPEGLQRWDRWHPPGDYDLSDPQAMEFVRRLGRARWLGVNWPAGVGGRGLSSTLAYLIWTELARRNLPSGGQGIWSVGPALIRHGTTEQQELWLPGLLSGTSHFALGLTEPSGGTDIGRLSTFATKVGTEYRIKGQKLFTTAMHWATHIWLAARTAWTDPPHRGISMFVIPVETVGVSTSPLFTQAGERTNVLYLDDVTVTEASRVGDEGTGMQIMLEAVDFERLTLAGPELRPTVEWLLAEATKRANFHDAMEIDLLEMLADASAAELLGLYAALRHDDGKSITIESAMLKLWTAELRGRIADVGLQCFGDSALLVGREADAPREGYLANLYQAFPLFRFGAGGIEVLKDVVAQRGFGMPRNR